MPFSDEKVLATLIRNRLSLDDAYKERVFPSGELSSAGGVVLNENILDAYIDLDRLIDEAPLSRKQRAVVELMMRGWSVQDIAEECDRQPYTISHIFQRAIRTLRECHVRKWTEIYTNST